jgi:Ni/Fe-hydrogenase subunit HybB-like protein
MSARADAVHQPAPIGGAMITRGTLAITALGGLGVAAILWRFIFGLGATTALNDGYPWGLWIAFDVVTGTAIACGGYAMAMLVYILNRGQYHPLVRSALLTSAFGYTMAGVSVALDVGRYWSIWKVPLYVWEWNVNSVLLEVALCIMAYTVVLWIELSPAFFERGLTAPWPAVRRLSERALPVMNRALIWLVALGLLLPTMHQSSLGSLMLLAGPRLHPLWNTPLLPLLFLVSCVGMGFAAVVVESTLSALLLRRASERTMLAGIARAIVPVFVVYLVLRMGDQAWRGQLGALASGDLYSVMSLVELALFASAPLMLLSERQRHDAGNLFRAAMLLIVAGALYRFDTFLVAFTPGPNWSYFPSVGEILVTVGLVALELLGYIAIIRFFPILTGATGHPHPARRFAA